MLNIAPTFEKTHATTVAVNAPIAANRFVCLFGTHASGAPTAGEHAIGVSETAAAEGETVSVVTGYSALVESAGIIAAGSYVCPMNDGSGRAITGGMGIGVTICGFARTGATMAGQLIEVILMPHLYASGS